MKRKVLIISNPDDEHTDVVIQRIKYLDCEPILFFPEILAQYPSLFMEFDSNNHRSGFYSSDKLEEIDFLNISSIWYRRPRIVSLQNYNLRPEGYDFAQDEWKSTLAGLYALLTHALWISHPDHLYLAARKPFQLKLAQSIGFRLPKTCITNNPKTAREFITSCNNSVIVKAIGSGWIYSENGEAVTYVLTNRLSDEDIKMLDEIIISPTIIQEEIVKAYELRVNIVGQKILPISIDSQSSPISKVDWRRYDLENTPYSPYRLPDSIAQKCLLLTKALNLEFGAIDLIRNQQGEYIFLEINGNGQFLWAESLTGVTVSDAIARLLCGISAPLGS